jgi:hypothetical protein
MANSNNWGEIYNSTWWGDEDWSANSLKIDSAPPGFAFTGILDTYTGAAAAYSVRKLSSTYTGAALRVRRVSDGTEQDIGFNASNELDTDALTAFVNGGAGFVSKWYDQSGGTTYDLSVAASGQPRIASASGVVTLEEGKPCLTFNGSSHYLTLGGTEDAGMFGNISVFSVNKSTANTTTLVATGRTATSNANQVQWGINSGSGVYAVETSDGTTKADIVGSESTGSQALTTITNDLSGNLSLFVNGVSDGSTASVSPMNDMSQPLEVGRDPWRSSLYFTGTMQELILYASLPNRTGIESNISTYYGITL